MDIQLDAVSFSEDNPLSVGVVSTADTREQLLVNVSLHLLPGSVTAVYGDSHRALNALIQTIALRQTKGYLEGCIYYDTLSRDAGLYRDIAYVPSEDDGNYHFDKLRVFETLYFAVRLRTQQSEVECRERARELAKFVGLDGSSFVGKLGTMEKRILSIACEVIGNPVFLCLQFPTNGLDAAGAVAICRILYKFAKRSPSLTVVYSISPPSAEMLQFTDEFAVLVGSRIVYTGNLLSQSLDSSIQDSYIKCINDISLALLPSSSKSSSTTTPTQQTRRQAQANQLLSTLKEIASTTKGKDCTTSASAVAAMGRSFPQRGDGGPLTPRSSNASLQQNQRRILDYPLPVRIYKPFVMEVWILISRAWKFTRQTKYQLRMSIGRLTIFGLIFGIILYGTGREINQTNENPLTGDGVEDNTYNITASLFAIVAMTIVGVSFTVPIMHSYVRTLQQEVTFGLHRIWSCWLAIILLDIPIYVVAATTLSALMYVMIEIKTSSSFFFGSVLLITLVSYSMACACSVTFKSAVTAQRVFAGAGFILILLAGYVQQISEMPYLWSWLSTLAFTRWGLQSLMLSTYDNNSQTAYLKTYNFDNESISSCYGWLTCWLLVFQAIILTALWPPLYSMKVDGDKIKHALNGMKMKSKRRAGAESVPTEEEIIEGFETGSPPPRSHEIVNVQPPYSPPMYGDGTGTGEGDIENGDDNGYGGMFNRVRQSSKSLDTMEQQELGMQQHLDSQKGDRANENGNAMSGNAQVYNFPIVPVPAKMQADLAFTRVKYLSLDHVDDRPDMVLHGISGRVIPGTSCCILTGSSDKSGDILLRVLSGRHGAVGSMLGSITVNDGPMVLVDNLNSDGSFKSHRLYPKRINSAYIARGDCELWPHLTVREVIRYAALLKRTDQRSLPNYKAVRRWILKSIHRIKYGRGVNYDANLASVQRDDIEFKPSEMVGMSADVEDRIEEVIKMLGIDDIADTQISTLLPTLSGGKRRLITIATELCNRPGLVFMEDPVYELSWNEAEAVGAALRSLTRGGRTLVCTLSTPTNALLECFDSTLLMGSGLQLYFGSTVEAVAYFENIGFEKNEGESVPEFLLDIAGERTGVTAEKESMRSHTQNNKTYEKYQTNISPMRKTVAINLSLEDLADLAKSLNNFASLNGQSMATLPSQGASSPIKVSPLPAKKKLLGEKDQKIPMLYTTPPVQPTGRVIAMRGFAILFSDFTSVATYFARAFIAGMVLGSLWWRVEQKDYITKVNLFASVYLFVNLALVDLFEGLHLRLNMFLRERDSGSSSVLAYWLADPSPSFILNAICCLLCAMPVYSMPALRAGFYNFMYFYIMLLSSVYCNTGIACLLSTLYGQSSTSKFIFNGVIMPLQILFSGFLILLPTMASWYSWISCICPMSFFIAGMLENEYYDNDISDFNYGDIEDTYGFHIEKNLAVVIVLLIGVFWKLVWLFSLWQLEASTDVNNLRNRKLKRSSLLYGRMKGGIKGWRRRKFINTGGDNKHRYATDDYLAAGMEMDMDMSMIYDENDNSVISSSANYRGRNDHTNNDKLKQKWSTNIRNFFSGGANSMPQNDNNTMNSSNNSRITGMGSPLHANSPSRDVHRVDSGGFFGAITGDININATALFEDDSQSYHEL